MNTELDRTHDPYARNEEFERWLDDMDYLSSLPTEDKLQTQWCEEHYRGFDPGEMDQDEFQDYLIELERDEDEERLERDGWEDGR